MDSIFSSPVSGSPSSRFSPLQKGTRQITAGVSGAIAFLFRLWEKERGLLRFHDGDMPKQSPCQICVWRGQHARVTVNR
jgi:hypothetical protein